MSEQVIFVWVWSRMHPVYAERIAAMSHPANVYNAFTDADMLFLVPKE
jgi:hypothetical protein